MPTDRLLPGRHHALSSGFPEELWLRDDHLLCIKQNVIIESYQRFYYRDIEGITVVATRRGLLLNLLFGAILAVGALLLLLDVPRPVFYAFAGLWLALTLINLAYGATCKTVLCTRINTRTLTSLRRMRSTRKALALLHERIRIAQAAESGVPPPVEAEAQPTAPVAADEPPPALGAPAAPPPPPLPPVEPVALRWHQGLATLLALQALVALNTAFYSLFGLAAGLSVLLLVTTGVAMPALIRQRREGVPASVRSACWWISAFQFFTVYVLLMAVGFLSGIRAQLKLSLSGLAENFNHLLLEHNTLRILFVVYAVIVFLLAVWQATALRSSKRS